jgi:hypothetical protein
LLAFSLGHCMNKDSCSGIDYVKNSSNAIPIGGCIQSCCNYCRFCSPWFLAVFCLALPMGTSDRIIAATAPPSHHCLLVIATFSCLLCCHHPLLTQSAVGPSAQLEIQHDEKRKRSMLTLTWEKWVSREEKRGCIVAPKWILSDLEMILIRLECMCISSRVPKRCTWILTCLVCPIPSSYIGMQSCVEIMMWQACQLITWWCGKPATSELTL